MWGYLVVHCRSDNSFVLPSCPWHITSKGMGRCHRRFLLLLSQLSKGLQTSVLASMDALRQTSQCSAAQFTYLKIGATPLPQKE